MIFKKKALGYSNSNLLISRIYYDNKTILTYANQLSYEYREFNLEKKISNSLPDLKMLMSKIRDFFNVSKAYEYDSNTMAEYIIDNYHLIEKQAKATKLDLEQLNKYKFPILNTKTDFKVARSLAVCNDYLRHRNGVFDKEIFLDFICEFQKTTTLQLKELYSLPVLIKIVSIGYISSVVTGCLENFEYTELAKKTFDIYNNDDNFKSFTKYIYDKSFDKTIGNEVFLHEFLKLMTEKQKSKLGYRLFLKCLKRKNIDLKKQIEIYQSEQAKNQLLVLNAISTLRNVSSCGWDAFFEKTSKVDIILNQDKVYLNMDLASKNKYKAEIEKISEKFGVHEISIAKKSIELCRFYKKHVGFFLFSNEKNILYKEINDNYIDKDERKKLYLYLFSVYIPTFILAYLVSVFAYNIGFNFLLSLITFITVAITFYSVSNSIVNRIFESAHDVGFIPRMNLKQVVNSDKKTMVITPCLVTDKQDIDELICNMEVNFIANNIKNIYFSIVADFLGSDKKISDSEKDIMAYAQKQTDKLNTQYGVDCFRFYFRKREQKKGKYIAYERKRGAVLDVCDMFLNLNASKFYTTKEEIVKDIDYIITLDSDTVMPHDCATKMIGAMIHPLNKPVLSKNQLHVESGYGMIAPNINVDIEDAAKSNFSYLFAENAGADSYASCKSNIYQDLFGSAIFSGKGIFDIRVFYKILKSAFKDERVLSHDFLEGHYVQTGFMSDVTLFDGFPDSYISWCERQHRWVRGDWQHFPWLFSNIKNKNDQEYKNPLGALNKFQILDNFFRSLLPVATIAILFLSTTFFAKSPVILLLCAIIPFFFDSILSFVINIIYLIKNSDKGATFKDALLQTKDVFLKSFYRFAFLPYEAFLMSDAIIRTIYRLIFSKKNLLEWKTSKAANAKVKRGKRYYTKKMWVAPALAIFIIGINIFTIRHLSLFSFYVLCIWGVSPIIANYLSIPIRNRKNKVNDAEFKQLNILAYKTYLFFNKLCKYENFYFPPDNYQEYPRKKPVMRTSPTNIAYALSSFYSGYVFGFLPLFKMTDIISRIIEGIEKSDKHFGHMFNWYDIENMKALNPKYVSSVDSGNLACYFVFIIKALDKALNEPLYSNCIKGICISILNMSDDMDNSISKLLKQKSDEKSRKNNLVFEINMLDNIVSKYIETYEKSDVYDVISSYKQEIEEYFPYIKMLKGFEIEDKSVYNGLKSLFDDIDNNAIDEVILKQQARLDGLSKLENMIDVTYDIEKVKGLLLESKNKLIKKKASIISLRNKIAKMLYSMDFSKLYDSDRDLFYIGYDYSNKKYSESYYDLFASESRHTSLIAVAKGDVNHKHWFNLARPVCINHDRRMLLSWSGTMFEYLMPNLLMKSYKKTMINETYHGVLDTQILYGRKKATPWGISESGYYDFDFDMYYQYKAFGIPKLGLRYTSDDNIVISPYASMLCIGINKLEVLRNLRTFEKINAISNFGLYEAIDFTRSDKKGKRKYGIVKSYMAHHQGMILASLTNFLHDNILQNVFHSSKMIMSCEYLLKEKIVPRNILIDDYNNQKNIIVKQSNMHTYSHYFLDTKNPAINLVSNGKISCMASQYGVQYLRYKNVNINTWSNDYLKERCGNFVYINDKAGSKQWSLGYEPSLKPANNYAAIYSDYNILFKRQDGDISSSMNIFISSERDIIFKMIRIQNTSNQDRQIDVLHAILPMLCSINDYVSHPAFSSLFLENIKTQAKNTIMFKKRSRDESGKDIYLGMKCVCQQEANFSRQVKQDNLFTRLENYTKVNFEFEDSLDYGANSLLAIKCEASIPANKYIEVCYIISASESLNALKDNLDSITDILQVKSALELAKTASLIKKEYTGISYQEKEHFYRILSNILYNIEQKELIKNKVIVKKDILFRYGLNEKDPYFVAVVKKASDLKRVKLIISAFDCFRKEGLPISLVIIDCNEEIYINSFKTKILDLINKYAKDGNYYTNSKITYIHNKNTSESDIQCLFTCANLILDASRSILKQLEYKENKYTKMKFEKYKDSHVDKRTIKLNLDYYNGFGGFSKNGRDYILNYSSKKKLPAPWVNVVTNENFGSVISTEGGGYTWANNSRLYRITPFKNNGFTDIPVESVFLRDDRYGFVKNIQPGCYANSQYIIKHAKGYSEFSNKCIIETRCEIFVPSGLSCKITKISLNNDKDYARKISLFYMVEPCLGESNFWKKMYYTDVLQNNIITIENPIENEEYKGKAYVTCLNENIEYTCDKNEVYKAHEYTPCVLTNEKISNTVGITNNTCVLIKVEKRLKAKEKATISFVCGFEQDDDKILNTVSKLCINNQVEHQFKLVQQKYYDLLSILNIRTPSKSFDFMVNSWLLYQLVNSRLEGKSGYFQSGGAFGFRDQLQDVLALLPIYPEKVKRHIVLCAKHQFIMGDVLHWWHNDAQGVRTKISDDLLFLPYAVCEYIDATNDYSILGETASYLKSLEIPNNKEDLYHNFESSDQIEDIYMHCVRAINHANKLGQNGLLLIKGGDWNDGMNRVGIHGKGESVWLTMFYYHIIDRFKKIADYKKDKATHENLSNQFDSVKKAIADSWDGKWFRRGYFDNGDALGSVHSDECKIDLLSQSWAVICGACDKESCEMAFNSAYEILCDQENGIIKLLYPPFNSGKNDPGYIKSYIKGVRENGGQYTHAASWYIISAAMLCKNEYAYKLFEMINPINLTGSIQGVLKYKGEPYAVSGDVYSGQEAGKAGWTWYTGSAGWLYRAAMEHILGFKLRGDKLYVKPCIPSQWDGFSIKYKYKSSIYIIDVKNKSFDSHNYVHISVDNFETDLDYIELIDDGKKHIACIDLI